MVRAVACEGKKERKNDSKELGGHVAKSKLPIGLKDNIHILQHDIYDFTECPSWAFYISLITYNKSLSCSAECLVEVD